MARRRRRSRRGPRPPPLSHSLALRFVLLLFVFLAVPFVIYQQFRTADEEKQRLLLDGAQRQGRLIASALRPRLEEPGIPANLTEHLARLVSADIHVRLLLRPSQAINADGFFLVASAPPLPAAELDATRTELLALGILGLVDESCQGRHALALRIGEAGREELVTSITPLTTQAGCWAVVTSHASAAYLGAALGQPYWRSKEVQGAAIVYVGMAVLALVVFVGIWRNLRRFRRLARKIGYGQANGESFAAQNSLPELHGVAVEFDRLVSNLRDSASSIRRAAEDNAHAFKTPIGVIRQSIEPLRRLAAGDARGARAVEMIEQSVGRLDSLVSYAQHVEETMADLVQPALAPLDLSGLLAHLLEGLDRQYGLRDLRFAVRIEAGIAVMGSADLIETVIENLVDNAVSFSSAGGTIAVTLDSTGSAARLMVEDEGPGVDPAKLKRIFERYYTDRAVQPPAVAGNLALLETAEPHFGIGLWLVRRNVEAMGGRIRAENRERGGFRIRIALPLAG